MKLFQQGMALFLSWCLVLASVQATVQDGYAQAPAQALQQSPQQLQQLVAPIALYPDGLVAQILAAATYPDQVVEAETWLEKHKNLTGEKLAKEVNKQHWDASVKALTQFPAVLANMNQNLAWTSELGDAYVNQQQAVTQAIQTMRQRAQQAGNLKTTPQEKVTTQGQTIVIQPAAPDVVYVPQYDPWLVYGYPLAVFPGLVSLSRVVPGRSRNRFRTGFRDWILCRLRLGLAQLGIRLARWRRVVYNHNTYISHSRSIVNRNNFHSASFSHSSNFHGSNSGGRGMRSSAFSGFNHGGVARASSFRGGSSFGGFHGGFGRLPRRRRRLPRWGRRPEIVSTR